ncbi:hypothetical protein PDIG_37330 [Penicillium digitatum PHI26]|uniref:Uncharacterized protein n=2 Tax=Penicillium digitatum TaxID=36651 RepID=K9FWL2_PEND2|nr:hypothetical protein PDIP_83920 [Penicillium digitatum Pd1]EKV05218.1 hypothetical protein PDIP_83920 [Penicillium digitatum Pd1]EKV13544.1 hypothetical protein PDIG_37330 [Penicillium digitatum PHI26]
MGSYHIRTTEYSSVSNMASHKIHVCGQPACRGAWFHVR